MKAIYGMLEQYKGQDVIVDVLPRNASEGEIEDNADYLIKIGEDYYTSGCAIEVYPAGTPREKGFFVGEPLDWMESDLSVSTVSIIAAHDLCLTMAPMDREGYCPICGLPWEENVSESEEVIGEDDGTHTLCVLNVCPYCESDSYAHYLLTYEGTSC